jgi:rSAM/selenodomain-associated transferase 1
VRVGPGATLVVLAKSPEPGRVKTRLCPPATPEEAADVAAAALLDTLDATAAVPGGRTLVAYTGRLSRAARRIELGRALGRAGRTLQRGDSLGERIVAAHTDAAVRYPGAPSLQVGMDTPQIDAPLLAECLGRLRDADAVLGPARDGGWWALGLRDPRAAAPVAGVPMSRDDTGRRTLHALRAAGLRVALLPELTDVDTAADARAVAAEVPGSRFAGAVERVDAFRAPAREGAR